MSNRSLTKILSNCWIDVAGWTSILWIAAGLLYRSALRNNDWDARPLSWQVLVGQALPWVLQFVAMSIPVLCFARWRLRWDRPQLLVGVLVPLVWGSAWWIAYSAAIPYPVTLDMVADYYARGIEARFAGPEWFDGLLMLSGTCVNPLLLRPPAAPLVGAGYWDFVLQGLSSLLNVAYWIVAARWIPIRRAGGRFGLQEFGRLLVAVLVWTLPMGLRAMAIV